MNEDVLDAIERLLLLFPKMYKRHSAIEFIGVGGWTRRTRQKNTGDDVMEAEDVNVMDVDEVQVDVIFKGEDVPIEVREAITSRIREVDSRIKVNFDPEY